MFYNKRIDIIGESEGYLDDWGIWHDGEERLVKTIKCDVQPANAKQVYDDFGYQKQVKYRIFADADDLLVLGGIIQYRGNKYKIVQLKDWDDYVDFIVDEVGDVDG